MWSDVLKLDADINLCQRSTNFSNLVKLIIKLPNPDYGLPSNHVLPVNHLPFWFVPYFTLIVVFLMWFVFLFLIPVSLHFSLIVLTRVWLLSRFHFLSPISHPYIYYEHLCCAALLSRRYRSSSCLCLIVNISHNESFLYVKITHIPHIYLNRLNSFVLDTLLGDHSWCCCGAGYFKRFQCLNCEALCSKAKLIPVNIAVIFSRLIFRCYKNVGGFQ